MKFDATLPPTWPNGPVICALTKLPCFETAKAAVDYFDKHLPGMSVQAVWHCPDCDGWHVLSRDRAPAGASSGSDTRHLTKTLPKAVEDANARRSSKMANQQYGK